MIYLLDAKSRDKVLASIGKLDPARGWDISVEPHKERRSVEQNRRLWALHELAAEVTGYTAAQMHEFALGRFYGLENRKVGQIVMVFPRKRSSMRNKKEFKDFMESTEEFYITTLGVWLE